MRILKMRASFGKLKGELELKDGFNCLCLPNEAGKSTWSAFLAAMFYGIDTSERANSANQGLPAKERYKPWDGSAMEGSVELLWEGRRITIERTAAGRIPMGHFCAYETDSGIPVSELTGENCGKILCGVERSVFERTAFIRQLGLAVTEDAALEKRLSALVSTGEEGAKTYLELEKELRGYKNKLIGRAGLLPRLEEELETVERSLGEIDSLQKESMALIAQKEAAQREQAAAEALLARIARAKEARKRAELTTMEEKISQQEALCSRLKETAAHLPGESSLQELHRNLELRENLLHTAKMDAAFGVGEAKKPLAPQGFTGLSGEEAMAQAEKDREEYRKLSQPETAKMTVPLVLSLLALAAGAGLFFVQTYAGVAVGAAGLVLLLLTLILKSKSKGKVTENRHKAEMLALRYGLQDCESLPQIAGEYAGEMEDYESQRQMLEQQKAELDAAVAQAQRDLDSLLEEIRAFAPNSTSLPSCKEALVAALRAHEQIFSQERNLEAMKQQYHALLLVLGSGERAAVDEAALELDEAKITYEERAAAQTLRRVSSLLDQMQGAVNAKGDAVVLEARRESLLEQISTAQTRVEVIDIALSALKRADETLRSRFSPQITAEAGKILGELTDHKYPTVLLSPDLSLSVRQEGGAVSRPAAAMSCGTADQMYLALRLAMCHQLLPGSVPLVLDDALVNFDDTRAAAAIELLKKEAEHRQVILFTCRNFGEI